MSRPGCPKGDSSGERSGTVMQVVLRHRRPDEPTALNGQRRDTFTSRGDIVRDPRARPGTNEKAWPGSLHTINHCRSGGLRGWMGMSVQGATFSQGQ